MYRQYLKLCALFSILTLISGQNDCGRVAALKDNRIVGGRVIGYSKYPWYAVLTFIGSRRLVCGGSLIHKKYVLTAAHCYKPFFSAEQLGTTRLEDIYLVKLGIDNICINEPNVQVFETEKVYIKEEYYENLRYSDIALLLLNNEVNDFTPVCLPFARYESNNRTNLMATIIGLGKESSVAWQLPCQVKEANVEIQPDSVCRKFLDNYNENGAGLYDAFCAGNGEGKIDTCQGDSGGPLQIQMENDQIILLGLTSFGFGCAKVNTYGVYTDVSHYLDWIYSKMNINGNVPRDLITTSRSTPITSYPSFYKRHETVNPWNMLKDILNW